MSFDTSRQIPICKTTDCAEILAYLWPKYSPPSESTSLHVPAVKTTNKYYSMNTFNELFAIFECDGEFLLQHAIVWHLIQEVGVEVPSQVTKKWFLWHLQALCIWNHQCVPSHFLYLWPQLNAKYSREDVCPTRKTLTLFCHKRGSSSHLWA